MTSSERRAGFPAWNICTFCFVLSSEPAIAPNSRSYLKPVHDLGNSSQICCRECLFCGMDDISISERNLHLLKTLQPNISKENNRLPVQYFTLVRCWIGKRRCLAVTAVSRSLLNDKSKIAAPPRMLLWGGTVSDSSAVLSGPYAYENIDNGDYLTNFSARTEWFFGWPDILWS
jgi:hypothetical protein